MVCSGVVFLNALRFFLFFYLVGGKAGEADDLRGTREFFTSRTLREQK